MQFSHSNPFQNLSLSPSSAGKVNVLCVLDRSGIDVFVRKGFYCCLKRLGGAWVWPNLVRAG